MYYFLVTLFLLFSLRLQAQSSNWIPTGGPYNVLTSSIAVDFNGDIYTGTNEGVFRSSNTGKTWEHLLKLTNPWRPVSLVLNKRGTLFVGWDSGLVRSTNKGISWEKITIVPNQRNTIIYALTITNDNSIVAIGQRDSLKSFFQYSTDQGNSWDTVSTAYSSMNCVAADSNSGIYLGVGGFVYCYSSTDFTYSSPSIRRHINTIACNKQGTVYASTDDSVCIRSFDQGKTWDTLDVPHQMYWAIATQGDAVLLGSENNVLLSNDEGNTWQVLSDLDGLLAISFGFGPNGEVFVGTNGGGVFRSKKELYSTVKTGQVVNNRIKIRCTQNPISTETSINYYLPQDGFTTIEIYSSIGQKVTTLISKSQKAGSYSLRLPSIPAGVNYCVIHNRKASETLKLFKTLR